MPRRFEHDHDEAYNDYKHEGDALWDGNDGAEDDPGPPEEHRGGDGGGEPSFSRREKAAGEQGMHTGWVYGAVVFTLVAITAVTVLLFVSSGHLTESGSAPPTDGDNKVKSVNRNSAGISNSPKAHSQLEVASSVRLASFLEEFEVDISEGGRLQ